MDEVLTLSEMESRYPDEWILIDDPETDESLEVVRGRVLFHSSDQGEMYRRAEELRPRRFATHYTGSPPEDVEFAL
jgi:hypothetical protein